MTTNKGQLSPASKPVNWINKAKRPRTTSTTPNATLDPARRVVDPGATYAGGRGWYAGGGGALTAVSVATASVGVAGGVSFDVERLRLLIGIPYTASRATPSEGSEGSPTVHVSSDMLAG